MLLIFTSLIALACGLSVPGGKTSVHDLSNHNIQEIANYMVKSYNLVANQEFTLGHNIKLVAATTQVVSGESYHLTFDITTHNQVHRCEVTVWDQPWIPNREVTSDGCAKYLPHKRATMGGMHDVELTDEVKKAAAFAADTLNARANTNYVQCLQAISGQKAQVVAGMKYEMNIILKTSTSKKGGDVSATHNCVTSEFAQIQSCQVKVWDQPWRTPRYIMEDDNIHCMALMS